MPKHTVSHILPLWYEAIKEVIWVEMDCISLGIVGFGRRAAIAREAARVYAFHLGGEEGRRLAEVVRRQEEIHSGVNRLSTRAQLAISRLIDFYFEPILCELTEYEMASCIALLSDDEIRKMSNIGDKTFLEIKRWLERIFPG